MRRISLYFLVIFLVAACKSNTLSISGKQEKAFISTFLDDMIKSNLTSKRPLHHYIDPQYLDKQGLKKDDFLVDAYSLKGYDVESYDNGMVTALIWGEDKNWMHRLQFKLSKEDGQLYLLPSLYENEYVTPWWTVDRDVEK